MIILFGLTAGLIACYLFAGFPLAFLYAVMWIDRVFIGYTRIAYEIGIELITASMIITGIIYGASFAFLFGFFVYPLVDLFRWLVATPFTPEWPPLVPSPDSAIAGATGFIAGILITGMPLLVVAMVCLIIRLPLCIIKDRIFYGMPLKPAYIVGIPFTLVIVYLLQFLVT